MDRRHAEREEHGDGIFEVAAQGKPELAVRAGLTKHRRRPVGDIGSLDKRLAIRSRRFASVLMQAKRDCDAAGIEPV